MLIRFVVNKNFILNTPLRIMWFRRDLRLFDNAAFDAALSTREPVLPIFIFDRQILDMLENKKDRRVEFIHRTLLEMQEVLKKKGSSLEVYYGQPFKVFQSLMKKYTVTAVYTNHDYEPYAIERDEKILAELQKKGIPFYTFKDQVIFEKDEVVKDDGKPYTVFTPYANKWRAKLAITGIPSFPSEKKLQYLHQQAPAAIPPLKEMGFEASGDPFLPLKLKMLFYSITRRSEIFPPYPMEHLTWVFICDLEPSVSGSWLFEQDS